MKIRNTITITFMAALTVFALAGCGGVSDTQGDMTLKDSGKISVLEDLSYNWGDINIEGGTVEHTFMMKNEGNEDLIIVSANTSCMCTNAEIQLPSGTNSPKFGMHEAIEWGGIVKPGEEFKVKVVFDPMAHGPTAVGPIERSIFIKTSSKANGNYAKVTPQSNGHAITELKTSGDVLFSKDFMEKSNKTSFIIKKKEHDFGVIKQSGGIVSYGFEFEYIGENPVTVKSVPTSCACTTAKISKKDLKKGDTGMLTVNLDPNLHEEPEGKFFKTVSILTEPALEENPEVKIWAEIDLDLGPQAYKLKEEHNDADTHEKGIVYHNVTAEKFRHMEENKDFFLIDVHTPVQEHIANTDAIIPYNEIEANISKLPKDKSAKIVLYCRSGSMSQEASQKLVEMGYTNVTNLEGGRNAYIELTE